MWVGAREKCDSKISLLAGIVLFAACVNPTPAQGAVVFLSKDAPDWNQPYQYAAPNGPGPNPSLGSDPFDAWCAPTSAANLLGYWEDAHGLAVADGFAFSAGPSSVPWPSLAIWHDRSLGDPRSPAGPAPTLTPNDLGWWMDTNHQGYSGWGNGPHTGTYVKDVHAGLYELLQELALVVPGLPPSWNTATRGAGIAVGTTASGASASLHASATSAWAEIVDEIKFDRPVVVHWSHWNLTAVGQLIPGTGTGNEAAYGGTYYTFAGGPHSEDPWGNDEEWYTDGDYAGLNLGHTTTAVGFIQAGDPEDLFAPANPTNWVIVHDNVLGTPRNVIVPLSNIEYASGSWVANTTASHSPVIPDPADLNLDGIVDSLDLGILLGTFGTVGTPSTGELNGTPPVDSLDLGILLAAFGTPPLGAATVAVPEPSTLVLLASLAAHSLFSRRRRNGLIESNHKFCRRPIGIPPDSV
ncbi:MAG: PEP-CTERM sorting domain-containing protein [Pirellulales bacterium]|nr:PEP-CTERM sorting domain-containing protein [Pirellulales bacterium]